jgi:protein gp37
MKTKIEWCDHTINPVKGLCPMACSYCYARRMYKRFKWDPEIRFDEGPIHDLALLKSPQRIFVGSTMELFGPWVKADWHRMIFSAVNNYPLHTFIFLTKRPQDMPKVWPDNCHVGFSSPTAWDYQEGIKYFKDIQAKVKFISFEPLCDLVEMYTGQLKTAGINWVILGRETPVNKKVHLPWQWFREIVMSADNENVPVFLKDNLSSLLISIPSGLFVSKTYKISKGSWLRQEFPE